MFQKVKRDYQIEREVEYNKFVCISNTYNIILASKAGLKLRTKIAQVWALTIAKK